MATANASRIILTHTLNPVINGGDNEAVAHRPEQAPRDSWEIGADHDDEVAISIDMTSISEQEDEASNAANAISAMANMLRPIQAPMAGPAPGPVAGLAVPAAAQQENCSDTKFFLAIVSTVGLAVGTVLTFASAGEDHSKQHSPRVSTDLMIAAITIGTTGALAGICLVEPHIFSAIESLVDRWRN